MAEQPAAVTAPSTIQDAVPSSTAKPPPQPSNPALRMMGIPNFRFRLPSRNWLIFLSLTGSFTTALLYDRYHKRNAQRRWCKVVSHLAEEPLPTTQMPRTITIFLSAPPGDGLRAAREHFHEYVKPILVAGALDWEVVEGRREGEVRANLASKIRRIRRRSGEESKETSEESVEDRLEDFRRGAQIRAWDGIQGDLILGRHTWKEYVRGLHEGWIGPLDEPKPPDPFSNNPLTSAIGNSEDSISSNIQSSPTIPANASTSNDTSTTHPPTDPPQNANTTPESQTEPSPTAEPPKPPEKPPPKPSPTPPHILPSAYPTSSLSPTTPTSFPPSTVLPFPHLLGFLNTPIRIYRFLNRRHLADDTGRQVATLVLALETRAFNHGQEFLSSADLDDDAAPSPPTDVVEVPTAWEQETILRGEEREWHKSAWTLNKDDERGRERPWMEKMVIDERIGSRMRMFVLGAAEQEDRVKGAEVEMVREDGERGGRVDGVLRWLGLRKDGGMKGWEMGLVGGEDE